MFFLPLFSLWEEKIRNMLNDWIYTNTLIQFFLEKNINHQNPKDNTIILLKERRKTTTDILFITAGILMVVYFNT